MKSVFAKRLILLDAHAILHRAYHALPDFTSRAGAPTGALYGLAVLLMKIINELKPDYLAACYDRPEATFRQQVYGEYKAGRPKTEVNLISQINRSREIFAAFDIPVYAEPGFEADDIIGTIVEEGKGLGDLEIIIASGDMDTMQLVDGRRVMVYTLKKGIKETMLYDELAVVSRFGFLPVFLPDFKGLAGDQSDNIIGVSGIGEKTARLLVEKFGSLEEIYRRLKENPALFSGAGLTKRQIEILAGGEDEAFFSKTLALIRRDAPIKFSLPDRRWVKTFDPEKVKRLFAEFDFRSLAERLPSLWSGGGEKKDKKDEPAGAVEPPSDWPELAIALWLLNSDLTSPGPADILRFAQTKDFAEARTRLLARIEDAGLGRVYREIELPLAPIIRRAEERGILLDLKYLKKLSTDYHQKLSEVEEKIFQLTGEKFNLNSPKQLAEVLFDRLGLSVRRLGRTAGGSRSTRESELVKLLDQHPAVPLVLKHREYQKILSTYVDALPRLVDQAGRLHTKLNQTGTTTGRMSSVRPNLQNIPADPRFGPAVRRAFVATPGFKWLTFDYSQIEMRVLAMLSTDRQLTEVFRRGEDIHTSVAALVFDVSPSEVTSEMRRRAKVINFGIIYGMGINSLRQTLGSSREEAEAFYEGYFAAFSSVKDYFSRVVSEARQRGFTETMFGRRRYFPGLKLNQRGLRAASERMALNAPLQGTAADIVKLAMIAADKTLRTAGLSGRVFLLLQVHDELIYEAETSVAVEVVPLIQQAMENVVSGPVPLIVNVSVGTNWAEAK